MFYQAPPDIPPAIVKFAKQTFKKPKDAKGMAFKYISTLNNKEVYIAYYFYKPSSYEPLCFKPILYDCHTAYQPTKEERHKIDKSYIIPKYAPSFIKQEHMCHRDKKAYNRHTRLSDYDIEVKHINKSYIPKAVIEYADNHFKDSWFPGADKRTIEYLTTWKEYEVYDVYWYSTLYHRGCRRPLFYNGKVVIRPDLPEHKEAMSKVSNFWHKHGRPHLHNKD